MNPRKPTKLTDDQKRTLSFIPRFTREHGYPPTFREIEKKVGFSSSSMVHYNLNRLKELGFLTYKPKIPRSIRVIQPLVEQIQEKVFATQHTLQDIWRISIVGQIVASEPIPVPSSDFSYYDAEETIDVPPSQLPVSKVDPERIYALRVKGDSMIEDMINDGDIVIMQRTQEANNGDTVAVWLPDDEETTLKRFYREGDRIRLQPANPTMEPIYILKSQPIEIQGKVLLTISSK